MKQPIWDRLRYFSKTENWGTPSKMSGRLLLLLDESRHYVGSRFYVSRGYDLNSSPKSTHREGKAADILLPDCSRHPLDILISLERFDWGGIGYYPHWKFGNDVIGGWHLDVRSRAKHEASARWMGVLDENGKQKYVALSYTNLCRYGVIQ